MWRPSVPDVADIWEFRKIRERHDLFPLVIHCNYLLNLASLDPVIRERSVASFAGELDRAAQIGAQYLVLHPGNYKNQTIEEGIAAVVLGMAESARMVRAEGVTVLLENTVGAGCQLGSRFEELRMIRDLALRETDLPIGYCLDTCHLFAAGFDIAKPEGLAATTDQIAAILGFDRVHVIHANDSKGGLGGRLDRHANIGDGQIGAAGFRKILAAPAWRAKPFILETPVDEEGDDLRNVQTLQRLSQPETKSPRAKAN